MKNGTLAANEIVIIVSILYYVNACTNGEKKKFTIQYRHITLTTFSLIKKKSFDYFKKFFFKSPHIIKE